MNAFHPLNDYRPCAICKQEDRIYDYDEEEYFLFRFGDGVYGHAVCLFQRFAFNVLVRIPIHTWRHFLWRIEESNWGMATPLSRQKRRRDLALLQKSIASAGVSA